MKIEDTVEELVDIDCTLAIHSLANSINLFVYLSSSINGILKSTNTDPLAEIIILHFPRVCI